ncbi:MAG TPA: 2-dehydropantoate 2-reductase [Rhizomicrobium sp.]|jgi:2-dehydropantoate 2-reductase|nr:2-dehydropantoate 2-reductase [Rhizomicrobium sp.]
MTSIALIGPGAIGGTVAFALAERGHDLTICANTAFSELGLTRADTEERRAVPVKVLTAPADARRADWVLLCVKSHQTASAAAWLKATIGPNTKIAVLQNGVEHREHVAPYVGAGNAVVPVIVILPAERTRVGEITSFGGAALTVPDDAAGRAFAALFDGSFVKASTDADFVSRTWEKLCMNAPSGALCALTLHPGALAAYPDLVPLAETIVEECMAVGRAEGARFADGFARQVVGMFTRPGGRGNSMYYDRRDGKPMEWDARNGVVQRLGRKHGIPTPAAATLVPLLKALSGTKPN